MEDFHRANPDWYPLLKENAKRMRNNPTEAEFVLWQILKGNGLGVRFKRQCVVLDFIADFLAPEINLIIEVDGGYHSVDEQITLDEARTTRLENKGYKVVRFTNEEVLSDTLNVITKIKQHINYERKQP